MNRAVGQRIKKLEGSGGGEMPTALFIGSGEPSDGETDPRRILANWRKYVADGSASRRGPALMFVGRRLTTEEWLAKYAPRGLS